MLEELQIALDFLIGRFKLERYIYLGVCLGAFLLLLSCAIVQFVREGDIKLIAGMVGATGAMGYCCSQILRMWSDCIKLITIAMSKRNVPEEQPV